MPSDFFIPTRKQAYTFWQYGKNHRERNFGWRLDYFLTLERMKKRIKDVKINSKITGSDHCLVTLEIFLEAPLNKTGKTPKIQKPGADSMIANPPTDDETEAGTHKTTVKALVTVRTNTLVEINLKPTNLEQGYLLPIPAKKRIYMRENLVKYEGNCCKIFIIDTSDNDKLKFHLKIFILSTSLNL